MGFRVSRALSTFLAGDVGVWVLGVATIHVLLRTLQAVEERRSLNGSTEVCVFAKANDGVRPPTAVHFACLTLNPKLPTFRA